MIQLWRTLALTLCVSAGSMGCTGQQLEGRWRGSFPLEDAKTCDLSLYSNRSFTLSCQGDVWVGAGRYRQEGERLRFDFTVLHRRRVPVRRLPVANVKLDGRGNEIVLTNDAGQSYRLVRGL